MITIALNHVVFKGVIPGIYGSRQEAEEQVKDFEGGKYVTYLSTKSARAAWHKRKRITKKRTLPFPPLKLGQSLNSIDIRRNTTVILERNSRTEGSSFTIHQKERRLSKLLEYPFISTETAGSIHLRSFYQMLLIAEDIIQHDVNKNITIYCTATDLIRASTFPPTRVSKNSLTRTNNVSGDIELVKLIHILFKQLESNVSFRQSKA